MKKTPKNIIWIVIAIAGGVSFLVWQNNNNSGSSKSNLIPEKQISHGHGLAVDIADQNKLWIATHYGLLLLENEKDLFRVGKSKDDYMGFSPHPTDKDIFFSSGHPSRGGNLGIQKSEDAGVTWEKISNGVGGPVDFHEMTISPANPNVMYGWYGEALQRSTDGGIAWEIVETTNLPQPIGFMADPKDENNLYALTIYGVSFSADMGKTWQDIFPELRLNLVTAFAMHPSDSLYMIAFSRKLGVMTSGDGGKTWNVNNKYFLEDFPVFIAYAQSNPTLVYTLTKANKIYKSINAGEAWIQIR